MRCDLRCLLPLFGIALFFTTCKQDDKVLKVSEISIIPAPQSVQKDAGRFRIDGNTTFSSPDDFDFSNHLFTDPLRKNTGLKLERVSEPEKADIIFSLDTTLHSENYRLTVDSERILLKGGDKTAILYGVQTIRQLLPAELETDEKTDIKAIEIPCLRIEDGPRFSYRGMHLDVGRHFFPKEFIKEYIDYLAMLKMNYFHWHLTEDQGWRIEIKQFPRLMSHAAYRNETLTGHYNDKPQKFDGEKYGGYYTQEEIKEIVRYATERHITIIPEIEMPGHAQAAVSAYPQLGCSGNAVEVATKWGVFENIFCPNQKTFAFLEEVLSEVIELFPGPYIHIGGDEAPKAQWEACSHCQELIREHNLVDENGLQSWFIKRIESFVNSKGKKIIGWDEILEGGLAPNATVMSWRGTQGGIEAAKEGHDVIMTPTSHAYFDYYQSDDPEEPLAIGGYLPLEKVYAFNPVPEELSEEQAKHILGAQGNVWTEYMKTPGKVQYMVFPRILAMSEVLWNGPKDKSEGAYSNFLNRVENFHTRLEALNINYANHLYGVEGKVLKEDNGKITYRLTTPTTDKQIRYKINGSEWLEYSEPIDIQDDSEIQALVFRGSEKLSDTFNQSIRFHKGILSKITLNKKPHPSYSEGGKEALINGISGSDTRYGDSEWLGFWGEDLEIIIEFNEEEAVSKIGTLFYDAPGQWIYAPETISVSGEMKNGQRFLTTTVPQPHQSGNKSAGNIDLTHLPSNHFSKLKIIIPSYGTIPDGKQGAGNKAWTFIDEIIIE